MEVVRGVRIFGETLGSTNISAGSSRVRHCPRISVINSRALLTLTLDAPDSFLWKKRDASCPSRHNSEIQALTLARSSRQANSRFLTRERGERKNKIKAEDCKQKTAFFPFSSSFLPVFSLDSPSECRSRVPRIPGGVVCLRTAKLEENAAWPDSRDHGGNVVSVKICGVTCVEDAAMAAKAGASFVGMILWPKAKRSVTVDTAAEIASTARRLGAEPVAVFVDEDAETIERICSAANIHIAQLHGDESRAALTLIPPSISTIFVLHADAQGVIQTVLPVPPAAKADEVIAPAGTLPDWILIDGLKGGSGESFDWAKLVVPEGQSRRGWMLAGGLRPSNVAEAVSTLCPDVVDVSSGVAGEGGVRKDISKVEGFISSAKGAVSVTN